MSVTLGTDDLLQYDARYSVLICRKCKSTAAKDNACWPRLLDSNLKSPTMCLFRGTKLRYFEVALPRDGVTDTEESPLTPSPTQTSVLTLDPCNLDLETLRYFHHFTTTTSLTLPIANGGPDTYWQTDMVSQALQLRWMMCGLLAISARHMAALFDDETQSAHLDRTARFQQKFFSGWGEALVKQRDSHGADIEGAKAGAQMVCIQRCCHWILDDETPAEIPFELESFTMTARGCVDPGFALHCLIATNEEEMSPEETAVSAETDSEATPNTGVANNAPPELLERFRTLPYRMAEVLGKPDSALDFFATMTTIEALVNCSSLSYASNDIGAAWMGMDSWLRKLPGRFKQMLRRRSPAALIVLAHWSFLIERAGNHCWFLRGMSAKLLHCIVGHVSYDTNVQELIWRLTSQVLVHNALASERQTAGFPTIASPFFVLQHACGQVLKMSRHPIQPSAFFTFACQLLRRSTFQVQDAGVTDCQILARLCPFPGCSRRPLQGEQLLYFVRRLHFVGRLYFIGDVLHINHSCGIEHDNDRGGFYHIDRQLPVPFYLQDRSEQLWLLWQCVRLWSLLRRWSLHRPDLHRIAQHLWWIHQYELSLFETHHG
ncbi:hypothetical protein AK830_g4026 [Neonectria ditissima]|uniref:Transcription factor domain-containing protein n=1 Tax=Neonectria ditissima TaxID=78410 RepID=A0A0N8H7R6_9HYPO|nr:hypothetical protein AK830_g4026 [Neonectria ditissima]